MGSGDVIKSGGGRSQGIVSRSHVVVGGGTRKLFGGGDSVELRRGRSMDSVGGACLVLGGGVECFRLAARAWCWGGAVLWFWSAGLCCAAGWFGVWTSWPGLAHHFEGPLRQYG